VEPAYRLGRHLTISSWKENEMAGTLRCALAVFVVLAIGQLAAAQTLGQAAAAARKAPPVDPALRADIERLMDLTGQAAIGAQLASTISDAFLNGLQQTQKNVPPRVIEVVREVINAEFGQVFAASEVKDKQIALYAKYYTHADVKGLIAFYETDLGRKAVANAPSLMREGAAIGQEWAKGAMPGVLQRLQARLKSEGLIP
jgi:uncharacterized protein